MVDEIELFLVGQGLLLVTFLAMVGLFLLLLFLRSHSGAGDRREARGWFGGGSSRASPPAVVYSDPRQRRGWFARN